MNCPLKTSPAWKALAESNVKYPYLIWNNFDIDPNNSTPLPAGEEYEVFYDRVVKEFGSTKKALREAWNAYFKNNPINVEFMVNQKEELPREEPTNEYSEYSTDDDFIGTTSPLIEEYKEEETFVNTQKVSKPLQTNESPSKNSDYSKTITMLSEIEGMPSIEELNNMSEDQLGEILKQLCK